MSRVTRISRQAGLTVMLRIIPRLLIVVRILACHIRMARLKMRIRQEIKSRRWQKAFLYYTGSMYAYAAVSIPLILTSTPAPKTPSALYTISATGLFLFALYSTVNLIKIGKWLSETDKRTWKLEGDLRFQLAQERVTLRRLKESW